MKIVHTNDGAYHRRWISLIPSIFLPGSAQFLAGRKRAGVLWFMDYILFVVLIMVFLIHPKSKVSVVSMDAFEWLSYLIWLAIVIDGFRCPIPRLGTRKWILFFCIWLCLVIIPLLGLRYFLIQPFRVPSSTMQPTIMGIHKDSNGKGSICRGNQGQTIN